MAEENPKIPLAPPRNQYPRSDEEEASWVTIKSKALSRKKSSKCPVYVLLTIVTLSAALLIFASTFLRANTPDVKLQSVTVKSLRQGNGTTTVPPSFNATLVAELTIDNNKNFIGCFEFKNCSGSVILYGGGSTVIGDLMIREGRVDARDTKWVNATVDVRSSNMSSGGMINSGVLKLESYAELHGKVNLFNVLKKKKMAQLNCSMNLVLGSKKIEDLVCS